MFAVSGALATTIWLVARGGDDTVTEPRTAEPVEGIWITAGEIASLPTSGPAWDELAEYARDDWGEPDIGDQNSNHDVHTLAGALYAVRLGDEEMRQRVERALESISEQQSTEVLAVSRNLLSYVVAADVIGYRTAEFERWLDETIRRDGHSRAGIETVLESALRDPSNHGAHARASTFAVARYVGDETLAGRIAKRFRDWLGRSPRDFEWRELDWQGDPDRPRGINEPGATIDGADVDGVLPEEQRRSGPFTTPAPQERYVWEGLQGTVATAEMLTRDGYDPWGWEDRALERAFRWLYAVNDYPAEGDDTWIPWIVERRTGLDLPTDTPSRPGKNIGFTDWTHAG